VAKEFNEFFTSIDQNTVDKIYSLASGCSYDLTQSSFVPRCYLPSQQFSFRPVNCGEVEKVITSMPSDKAPAIGKISSMNNHPVRDVHNHEMSLSQARRFQWNGKQLK